MTLENTQVFITYRGNGTGTAFPVPFPVLDRTHLVVSSTPPGGGTAARLALGNDYSVTLPADGIGGTVTLNRALADGAVLRIERRVGLVQEVRFTDQGYHSLDAIEKSFDKLTMIAQQLAEDDVAAGERMDALDGAVGDLREVDSQLRASVAGLGESKAGRDELQSAASALAGADAVVAAQVAALSRNKADSVHALQHDRYGDDPVTPSLIGAVPERHLSEENPHPQYAFRGEVFHDGVPAVTDHAVLYNRDAAKQHASAAVFDYTLNDSQAVLNSRFSAGQESLSRLVTQTLTLYVGKSGKDSNDGLTAAKALLTMQAAFNLLDNAYAGFIRNFTLNVGEGVWEEEWSLPKKTSFGRLVIAGAGRDATVFYRDNPISFGRSNGPLASLEMSGFCVRRKPTTNVNATMTVYCAPWVSISDLCLDHSERTATINGIVLRDGVNGAYINGPLEFRGRFSSTFYLNYSRTGGRNGVYFGPDTAVAFNNVVGSNVFGVAGDSVVVRGAPTYTDCTFTRFAYLQYGARLIFENAATRTAWENGMAVAVDGSSSIVVT